MLISGFAEYTDGWKRRKLQELIPDIDMAALGASDSEAAEATSDPLAFESEGGSATEAEQYTDLGDDEFGSGSPPPGPVDDPGMDLHEPPERESVRAVDSVELQRIQEMDRSGRWGQAVDRYGAQFLLRIHFRKYEFDKVRWLLRTGKIAREEDVRFIRDTIRLMESRVSSDLKLGRFQKDMADIRRIAQMKLNSIHQAKKNAGGQ